MSLAAPWSLILYHCRAWNNSSLRFCLKIVLGSRCAKTYLTSVRSVQHAAERQCGDLLVNPCDQHQQCDDCGALLVSEVLRKLLGQHRQCLLPALCDFLGSEGGVFSSNWDSKRLGWFGSTNPMHKHVISYNLVGYVYLRNHAC